jgi:hypothetical protein
MNTSHPKESHDIAGSRGRAPWPIPAGSDPATHPGNGSVATWSMDTRPDARAREPIASSNLMKCPWPRRDPTTVVQGQRLRTQGDRDLVQEVARALLDANADRILDRTRGRSPAERVQCLLSDSVLNFNPCPLARDSSYLRRRFEAHTRRSAPIALPYPLFCKIGNGAKVMFNDGPTAAEEISIRHFLNIDRIVRSIYEPGLRFVLLCDARLYNTWLLNPEVVVSWYMLRLRQMIAEVDDRAAIELVDYAELLGERHHEFVKHYATAHQRMQGDLASACPGVNLPAAFESLRASICTRHMGMSYDDYVQTFSRDRNPENPHHRRFDELAKDALIEMLAIRHACYVLEADLFTPHWPDAVRVTCHVSHDPERPLIGLRTYPDYRRCSQLLPYHGAPVIFHDGRRLKMAVHAEVRLRAHPGLIRVTCEDDETYFYSALEAGIQGDDRGLSGPSS